MLIRIIFYALLFYLFVRLAKKLFLSSGSSARKIRSEPFFKKTQAPVTDEMVQDPVCQVFVPKKDAISFFHANKTYYFCSRECLEKFKAGNR